MVMSRVDLRNAKWNSALPTREVFDPDASCLVLWEGE